VATGDQDIEREAPEFGGAKCPELLRIRGLGERYSSPSGIRGGAPRRNDFRACNDKFSIDNLQFEKLFICHQYSSILQHTITYYIYYTSTSCVTSSYAVNK